VIRVLVVDDSPVLRELMVHLLESDPQLTVIGTAVNGHEAVEAVQRLSPDVVAMDYHMPSLDGMEATRLIMQTRAVPIVIVSGSSAPAEAQAAFRLLEAGALAVVAKPRGPADPGHDSDAAHLVQTVKLMAEVKVVRRWPTIGKGRVAPHAPVPVERPARADTRGVVIGASTGGPVALKTILERLPKHLPVPVLIVQHIAVGFTDGLARWLGEATGFPVHIASHGLRPKPGHAYLAPEAFQMKLALDGSIALADIGPINGHCPSVAHLFDSAAIVWGARAIAVLLTGMGRDGAQELKLLRSAGALTLAQDEESSTVHGMPGEAIRLGAACHVLSPQQIGDVLARLAS
jgi:two-component system, chemotaxis family, protein-glutamate methylesterase/glutaminase